MKAVLKFDLEDPDQYTEHIRCIKSLDMASALFEIQANLKRDCIDNKQTDDIFEKINDIIEDYDLNTSALIS